MNPEDFTLFNSLCHRTILKSMYYHFGTTYDFFYSYSVTIPDKSLMLFLHNMYITRNHSHGWNCAGSAQKGFRYLNITFGRQRSTSWVARLKHSGGCLWEDFCERSSQVTRFRGGGRDLWEAFSALHFEGILREALCGWHPLRNALLEAL